MELIRGLVNLREHRAGCVVSVGTYDGIHVGHQTLIRRLMEHGALLGKPSMVLTFEPMPREFFAPDHPPPRLTSLRERWRILARLGLDYLGLLRFDEHLRNMTGEAFARFLAHDMNAAMVVVGHDFKFGRGGQASAPALVEAGQRLGFGVEIIEPVKAADVRVSSSAIRDALAHSDFVQAARWLGRPYSMLGRVVRGERLGHKLGYPTANLRLSRLKSPVQGIFAVRIHGAGAAALPGVASLGTRPTVGGGRPLLEAHIFDYNGDLYGREIEVEFVAKLRDEQHFASLDALVAQMHGDAAAARRILNC
jgi:riboflavin kinase/FMN adenylyltransferase